MAARNGYPSNIEGMVTKQAITSIRNTSKNPDRLSHRQILIHNLRIKVRSLRKRNWRMLFYRILF